MAKSLILAAAVLLALAASASAQCIQCSQCTTNNCFQFCQPSCVPSVNGKTCEGAGNNKGASVAKDACALTITFCGSTSSPKPKPRSYNPVSLGECQNIYYSACANNARKTVLNTAIVPKECKDGLTKGYKGCSKDLFDIFFSGEVSDRCKAAASTYKP